MKKYLLFTILVMSTIWSFGQPEWQPAHYNEGDTVKVTVTNSLFVARRNFNSNKIPADNSYWNYVGQIPNGLTLEKLDARLKILEGLFGFDTTNNTVDTVVYVPPVDTLGDYTPPIIDTVPPTDTLGSDITFDDRYINFYENIPIQPFSGSNFTINFSIKWNPPGQWGYTNIVAFGDTLNKIVFDFYSVTEQWFHIYVWFNGHKLDFPLPGFTNVEYKETTPFEYQDYKIICDGEHGFIQLQRNGIVIKTLAKPEGTFNLKGIGGNSKIEAENFRGWLKYFEVSNTATPILDRDYESFELPMPTEGIKQIQTTGTIQSGSNIITVADASKLRLHDKVIIELGGEVGKGLIGTAGVGEQYPWLTFANAEEMNANPRPGYVAWTRDNGLSWIHRNGQWEDFLNWHSFARKAIPWGLWAEITAIDGNKLTLSKSAGETSTSANVYYDIAPVIQSLDKKVWKEVKLPAGKFATSYEARFSNVHTVSGAGIDKTIIFSPKGVNSATISMGGEGETNTIHDLTVIGNSGVNGFGLTWYDPLQTGAAILDSSIYVDENPFEMRMGIRLHGKGLNHGYNLKVVNPITYALECLGGIYGGRGLYEDCEIVSTGQASHDAWLLHFLGTDSSHARRIKITADAIVSALEAARCTNTTFEDIDIVNGICASNSSANTTFKNITITQTPGSSDNSFINKGHPFFDINKYMETYDDAIKTSADAWTLFENVKMIQQGSLGRINAIRGISCGEGVGNVTVKNCVYQRPENAEVVAVYFENANNNVVDGLEIKGSFYDYGESSNGDKYHCDISMVNEDGSRGTGVIRNVTGARYIHVSEGVVVENINPECKIIVHPATK